MALYLVTNVRSRDKLEKTPNFTRFMTTKLGRMVASGRRFVTQMPSRHWPLFVNVSIIWITVVLYCYALPWSKYHVNVLCETGNKKPFVLRYLSRTAEMKKALSSSQPIPTDWPKSEKLKSSNGYSFHLETLAPVLSTSIDFPFFSQSQHFQHWYFEQKRPQVWFIISFLFFLSSLIFKL